MTTRFFSGIRAAWLAVMIGFVCTPVQAASVEDFATVGAQDVSAQFLMAIFGPSFQSATSWAGGSDYGRNAAPVDSNEGGLLGPLAQVVNDACLVLVVLIIFGGGISGSLQAAFDGVRAADKYSSLWIPIRSSMSFLLLVPVSGGYSVVQVLTFKVLLLSVGIANAGYQAVLRHIDSGRPVVYIKNPQSVETALNVLGIRACEVASNGAVVRTTPSMTSRDEDVTVWQAVKNFISTPSTINKSVYVDYVTQPGYDLGDSQCGSIKFEMTYPKTIASAGETSFNGQWNAFLKMESAMKTRVLDPAVASFKATNPGDQDYGSGYGGGDPKAAYVDAAIDIITTYERELEAANRDALSGRLSQVVNLQSLFDAGWLMAGAMYWQVAQTQSDYLKLTMSQPKASVGSVPDLSGASASVGESYTAVMQQFNSIRRDVMTSNVMTDNYPILKAAADPERSFDQVVDPESVLTYLGFDRRQVVEKMIGSPGDGDFVSRMASTGQQFFNWGLTLYGLASAATLTADVLGGGGGDKEGVAGAIKGTVTVPGQVVAKLLSKVGRAVITLSGMMIAVGIFLGFYLPAIPAILWLINVTNWLGTAIKAVFATPIWAVAHAIPDGEGFVGQRAQQGWLLLLSLSFYPLLMLTGMFAGMVMIEVVGRLLTITFPVIIFSGGGSGVFGNLIYMIMLGVLAVTLANKCFGMSTEMVDETLRWINGGIAGLTDNSHSAGNSSTTTAVLVSRSEGLITSGLRSAQEAGARAGGRNSAKSSDKDKKKDEAQLGDSQ